LFYRIAEPQDARALADFAGRLFVESYRPWMEEAELQDYIAARLNVDALTAELRDAACTTYLAFDDNEDIAGYAQVAIGNWPDCALPASQPAELRRIYVDQRWHGQQIASALLSRVLRAAGQHHCDVLWLAVWEINERAIAFYEKHRFREVGRQGFPIGSEIQTDLVLARPLADELQ
jgi:ribosomal protein S18 acetylase RimI-like enzyme